MKKIRYIAEYIILWLVLSLSKLLTVTAASTLGGAIGRTIGPRLAASRKAYRNIEQSFPDKSADEYQRILKGMWDNLGRTLFEYSHLKKLGREHVTINGLDILEKHKDRAAIIFSGHLANWELVPIACYLQSGFVTQSLYRAPNNPMVDHHLKKLRSMDGQLNTIPKSKVGTRQMVKLLQDQGHIGALIDQKYNEGVEALFFGRPAMTSTAFIDLAKKFDCPLIPIRIERTDKTQFLITIEPPIDISGHTDDILTISHKKLEEWITERPDQWLWLHKRWKE